AVMAPLASWLLLVAASGAPAEYAPVVPRFPLAASGLELRADADRARFYDVVGRRSALFGYEGRPAEVWAYPLTLVGTFRPRLRLMWPAGLMTPNLDFDEKQHFYVMSEESRRFVGVVGSPGARSAIFLAQRPTTT